MGLWWTAWGAEGEDVAEHARGKLDSHACVALTLDLFSHLIS